MQISTLIFILLVFKIKESYSSKSLAIKSTPAHDIKISKDDQKLLSLVTILAYEVERLGLEALFVNQLSINGNEIQGPMYFTIEPIFLTHGKAKYFFVPKIKFYRNMKFIIPFPNHQNGIEDIKRSLVTRDIFIGRTEDILVGKVHIDDVNYGPILLPALRTSI